MKPKCGTKLELRRWAAAWKRAGLLNRSLRHDDLRKLTNAQAWHKTDCLLSGPRPWRPSGRISGLLEQQRLFRRLVEK